jgi:hypothetical protein
MSLKSILRAFGWPSRDPGPQSLGEAVKGVRAQPTPFLDRLTARRDREQSRNAFMRGSLDRLTARRDWGSHRTAEPLPIDPAPAVAPWDTHTPVHTPFYTHIAPPLPFDGDGVDLSGRGPASPVWPPQDDPYAKPEPCAVVQDPGKSNIDKLAERGLLAPLQSIHGVTDLISLIERQEAAEKKLIKLGYAWIGNMWCQIGDGPTP